MVDFLRESMFKYWNTFCLKTFLYKINFAILLVVDFFYEIQYMVKNKNIHKVWKINLRGRWIDRQGHITYGLRG